MQCTLSAGLEDRRPEVMYSPSDSCSQTKKFWKYLEGCFLPTRNSSSSPEGYSPMTFVDSHKMVEHFSLAFTIGLYFDQLHLRK